MLTVLSVGFLVCSEGSREPRSRQKSADFFMGDDLKGKKAKGPFRHHEHQILQQYRDDADGQVPRHRHSNGQLRHIPCRSWLFPFFRLFQTAQGTGERERDTHPCRYQYRRYFTSSQSPDVLHCRQSSGRSGRAVSPAVTLSSNQKCT